MVNIKSLFPYDWISRTLHELADSGFQNGLFYEVSRKNKGIPIVNVGNLYGSVPIDNDGLDLFDAMPEEVESFGVKTGDVFFTRSSVVPAGIAMCNVYLAENESPVVFDSHVIKYSADRSKVDPMFLVLQCRMPLARQHLIGRAKTATMTTIDQDGIGTCPIILPELPEQKAIVDVIETFNIHIANLSELIEKKRCIRKGALEDLVSGKTRLNGFDSEWVTVPFDKYFSILKNNTYARDQLAERGTVGNIHYGDVLVKFGDVISDSDDIPFLKPGVEHSEKWLLQEKDVIIADTAEDETVGKAIQVGKIPYPIVGGLHTIVCRPNYDTATGFLGYYINSKEYHDQLLPHITGIKVSSISKKAIKTTEVRVPKDVKEQAAITEILASMDSEIKVLEEEREKMIQICQGAMDDLLTGKVRLSL